MNVSIKKEDIETIYCETVCKTNICIDNYKANIVFKETYYDDNDSEIEIMDIKYEGKVPDELIGNNEIEEEIIKYLKDNIEELLESDD